MSTNTHTSLMAAEVAEIPAAIARCLSDGHGDAVACAQILTQKNPEFLVSIARGSSDHAASFLSYAAQIQYGVPVMSLSPSVLSIYDAPLKLARGAAFAISQSGESPDLIAAATKAKAAGAGLFVLTNTSSSTLAALGDQSFDMLAGPEKSVAATKSFVNSIVSGLMVLAEWQNDDALRGALQALPQQAAAALNCDWSSLVSLLDKNQNLFVLGRGPSFAIAAEAALKFKETSGLHAEAYSAAEVIHGPWALVDQGFDVLLLCARDASFKTSSAVAEKLASRGADVHVTADISGNVNALPVAPTGHPLTDALLLVVPFYAFVEKLARARGFDPDQPPNLKKVTETH